MSKTIDYFLSTASPFTYLGHERFCVIAARHGAQVRVKPIDLGGQVFPGSGGLPVGQRPPQRRAYRLIELRRWSRYLDIPINVAPRYWPVAVDDASRLIIAADQSAGTGAALRVTGAVLRAVWADQKNIADHGTLIALAADCGLDGEALLAQSAAMQPIYQGYTQEAIDLQVFGAPWFVIDGEPFWGQDRLDLLDWSLGHPEPSSP